MFLWMFIEGIILYHMTTVAYSRGPENQMFFYLCGWCKFLLKPKKCRQWLVWPDWAIFCTLGNFLSLWQQLIVPNCPCYLAICVKVSKSFIFLVKSFYDNFYRHLATFYWSHWWWGLGFSVVRWLNYLINIWPLATLEICPIAIKFWKSMQNNFQTQNNATPPPPKKRPKLKIIPNPVTLWSKYGGVFWQKSSGCPAPPFILVVVAVVDAAPVFALKI